MSEYAKTNTPAAAPVGHVMARDPAPQVVVVQQTPAPCQHKNTEDGDFTCCGICLGVCFFPIGLICCFMMRDRRCANCKAPVQ